MPLTKNSPSSPRWARKWNWREVLNGMKAGLPRIMIPQSGACSSRASSSPAAGTWERAPVAQNSPSRTSREIITATSSSSL